MAEKNEKKPEETPAPAAAPEKKKLPQLGALEDDDEFEDFPASGELFGKDRSVAWCQDGVKVAVQVISEQAGTVSDALAAGAPGADQLWEDNWDDDDVEDDFQKQLRQAIAERAGGGDEAMKE